MNASAASHRNDSDSEEDSEDESDKEEGVSGEAHACGDAAHSSASARVRASRYSGPKAKPRSMQAKPTKYSYDTAKRMFEVRVIVAVGSVMHVSQFFVARVSHSFVARVSQSFVTHVSQSIVC